MDRNHNLATADVQHSFLGSNGNGRSQDMAISISNLPLRFIIFINMRNNNLDHTLMSDDEIIAVVQAHKEGKKIEVQPVANPLYWSKMSNTPIWNFSDYDYRVAPEPRKPREWTLYFYNGVLTHICPTTLNYETIRVREVIEEDKRSTVQKMMEHATGFKND